MPFTPFHMGPGLVIKAGADREVSVLAFGVAQVAMDIEPALAMAQDAEVLHGLTHTLAGALVIGLLAMAATPPLCRPLLRRYNREVEAHNLRWLVAPATFTRRAVAAGALLGTFTHLFFDALMHADMRPLWPLSTANPLLSAVSVDAVYAGCFWAGIVGSALWLARRWRARDAQPLS